MRLQIADCKLQIADCRLQIGLLIGALAFAPQPSSAETIDRVLAVVAGQIITLSDVIAARELRVQAPATAADPIRGMLTTLIDRALVLSEVERYALADPAPEAIDREIEVIRGRLPSGQSFNEALARAGLDERHLREMLRQDLRIRAYEDQRFAAADPARRQTLISDWVAGLRRRADIIDLYLQRR
jgi:hypothetical protein